MEKVLSQSILPYQVCQIYSYLVYVCTLSSPAHIHATCIVWFPLVLLQRQSELEEENTEQKSLITKLELEMAEMKSKMQGMFCQARTEVLGSFHESELTGSLFKSLVSCCLWFLDCLRCVSHEPPIRCFQFMVIREYINKILIQILFHAEYVRCLTKFSMTL